MNVKEQLITPEIAKKYLANNNNNRNVKENVVKRYAEDMAQGRWLSNTYEMIKISKTSTVLDGQHRLLAVIKSNVSVTFHVASNIEDKVFSVLDTGVARNACDSFLVQGVKNPNQIPSIISTYYGLSQGSATFKRKILTNKQLIEKYFEKPDMFQEVTRQSIGWASLFMNVLPVSHIGGFHLFFSDINHARSIEFMAQLCSGVGIKNNTINILRNALIRDKIAQRKMNTTCKFALIIKAWNAFRKNETPKRLEWVAERDLFPKAL